MTTVGEIIDQLSLEDLYFMQEALGVAKHIDLALIPFTETYPMYRAVSFYGRMGLRHDSRQADRIKKKLKRSVIKAYPDRKNCTCPFCKARDAKKATDDDLLNGEGSGLPSGLWASHKHRMPVTQQLPTRLYRSGTSHIQGLVSSFVILDEIASKAAVNMADFTKEFRELLNKVEKGSSP
jgi:hypothetical protein